MNVTRRTKLSDRLDDAMARLAGTDPNGRKASLLIVDDEKGPRESLRMILSPQHRVLVAENAYQALEILGSEPVDVVTVDLNMPGMKGDALMRRIRRQSPDVEVIIITGFGSVESAVDGIRNGVFDYLAKPFDVVEVSSTVRRALGRRQSRQQLVGFLRGIGEVLGSERPPDDALRELEADAALREQMRAALESPSEDRDGDDLAGSPMSEFLETLAETIESREPHKCGHARRVAFLCGLLSERLGLAGPPLDVVRTAAFLHDIGRIGVVSGRAIGDGDAGDPDALRTHPLVGDKLVRPLGFPAGVAEAIRHHHERWDGCGVPDGLREDEIPLTSRMIAVADEFDGLTHDHPYRQALSQSAAVEELRKLAGSALDPALVREFIAMAESGLCATGPLLDLTFTADEDPINTIAAATAWIEGSR